MDEVYARLAAMIGEELDAPPPALGPDTILDDIPGWDSVTLAGVLVAIEEHFGVVPNRRDIDALATGADLARLCEPRT